MVVSSTILDGLLTLHKSPVSSNLTRSTIQSVSFGTYRRITPPDLTVMALMRRIDLPLLWSAQEHVLGLP
jgi:hypothetical protein